MSSVVHLIFLAACSLNLRSPSVIGSSLDLFGSLLAPSWFTVSSCQSSRTCPFRGCTNKAGDPHYPCCVRWLLWFRTVAFAFIVVTVPAATQYQLTPILSAGHRAEQEGALHLSDLSHQDGWCKSCRSACLVSSSLPVIDREDLALRTLSGCTYWAFLYFR